MSLSVPAFQNPSVMKYDFSRVPKADIPRSAFNRSHGWKGTFEGGYLIPFYVDEALPGDTFRVNCSAVIRMPHLLRPIMDNLYCDFFFFAVPNRLVWENWQRFCGERDPDPDSSIDYTVPQVTSGTTKFLAGTLYDYFGCPTDETYVEVNNLHGRAYNLIWNDWFRDQDLQDSVTVDVDNGLDSLADYVLLRRNKRHDYFTSCRPQPQKGTAVDLPLGSWAEVVTRDTDRTFGSAEEPIHFWDASDGTYRSATRSLGVEATTGDGYSASSHTTTPSEYVAPANLWADLSGAVAADINDLREAFQIQRLMERDARSGTRYIEMLRSHFGVISPDFRMQRPEYLGGGSRRIHVEPVPDTGSGTLNIGNLRAAGYLNVSGIGFTKSFVEHCVLIGLVNVRADITYQQGLNRMWSRQTRYDFYWPALAHLGEQAVLQGEIYTTGTGSEDETVFGYQERWAEYKYKPSVITGQFRSNHATPLDSWHLCEEFSGAPVLNSSFIECDPPIERVVSVQSEPEVYMDAYFDVVTTRPMPTFSVPGLIDHL